MWLRSYSGHGNGSKYVAEDTLQQVPCRSAAILMGCSSGRLVAHGSLDASGTVLHYLLAGAYVDFSLNILKLDGLTLRYYRMYIDFDLDSAHIHVATLQCHSCCQLVEGIQ